MIEKLRLKTIEYQKFERQKFKCSKSENSFGKLMAWNGEIR